MKTSWVVASGHSRTLSISTATALLLFSLLLPGLASDRQLLRGHVPAAAARLTPLGSLPSATRLDLAIGLPLRNREALTNLLRQVTDPASPEYRHYLTPEEFARRFGPTEADYEAVRAFAQAHGLTVRGTHPNRALLDVNGSVADIEQTLHVKMRSYPHPIEDRSFYAPDSEPSVDLSVPLLYIGGLNNYSLPQPRLQAKPIQADGMAASESSPNLGSGPSGSGTYIGNDFRAAYVPDTLLTGSGQSVGLLQFDGYRASDITYYEQQAGLPNVPLQNVLIDGASGNPSGTGGEVEVSLDIEMAISMAPGLAKVIVYMAPNPAPFEDLLNRMATDNLAKQLSCSWYQPYGVANPAADQIFQQMALQGQTFFSASGDNDAFTGLIDFPGDTPYITQVGGTTLSTAYAGGPRTSERVWNRGNGFGSGGGISTQYPIPSWQTNINMTACQGSTTKRNVPDVALTAENVYVRANGRDYSVGGTSCAAPLWAGFTALVNQQAKAAGCPTVGFINAAIDAIGTSQKYSSCFNDISLGDNTSIYSPTRFYAVAGYDLCTGWGTPAGQNLINALANPEPLQISPATGFASMGGVGGPFTVTSQDLVLTNSSTNSLSWSLVNTSLWLNASPASGTLLPGGPANTVTVSLSAAANALPLGTYTAAVWFTNLTDNTGQSRQFTLSIISPPSILTQPVDQPVLEGAGATFSVSAAGGLPLFYQWQQNGTNLTDGGNVLGSSTTNLVINNVSAASAGLYSVIVSNAAGVVTSSNALLSLTPSAPVIAAQPAPQWVAEGGVAMFSVRVLGTTPMSFQWSCYGTNLADATNSLLVLNNVQLSQAGNYAVVVTNSLGSTPSSNALLTVTTCLPPFPNLVSWWRGEGDAQDAGGTNNGVPAGSLTYGAGKVGQGFVLDGTTASATIPASPSLTVQSLTIEGWINPSNVSTEVPVAEYAAPTGWAGVHFWVAQGSPGTLFANIRSLSSTLDANIVRSSPGLVLSNQWSHIAVTYDQSSGVANLYLNGTNVAVKTIGSVTPNTGLPFNIGMRPATSTDAGGGTHFRGMIDELSLYNRALSPNEILAIFRAGGAGKCFTPLPPTITGQPLNKTANVGDTVVFSTSASGTLPLNYQWFYNGTNALAGITNSSLTLINISPANAGTYSVVVTNLYGMAASSNAVLTVLSFPPTIPTQPGSQSATVGSAVVFSVVASGSPPLSYQWLFNGTNNIASATNSNLLLTNVQFADAGSYSVIVTNPYGWTVSSNALLTVNPPPPCVALPGNLVSWWRAEADGNDAIGTNNITSLGGIGFAPGEAGLGFSFDGGSHRVLVPDAPELNFDAGQDFTIEAWIQPQTESTTYDIMSVVDKRYSSGGTDSPQGYELSLGSGKVHARFLSAGFGPAGPDLRDGKFHHVAWTLSRSSTTGGKLYVDGAVVLTFDPTPYSGSLLNTQPLRIGNHADSNFNTFFKGIIDEVSIYRRALSAAEIALIYQAGSSGKCLASLAPVITSQPTNQSAQVGGVASFSVAASGKAPLSYQWRKDTVPLAGQTNTSLVLTNVQLSQAGRYSVLVTNDLGLALSLDAVLSVTSLSSCTPPSSGLVSWWRAEGNLQDAIGTNNGAPAGNLAYNTGQVGLGLILDGTSASATVPASPSLTVQSLTIEGWINPSNVSTELPVAEYAATTGWAGVHLWIAQAYPGTLFANIRSLSSGTDANIIRSSPGLVPSNQWSHVAVTYDRSSGVVNLYLNGTNVAMRSIGSVTPNTGLPLNIGVRPATSTDAGGGTHFRGKIDELSVYNRALLATEIQAIFNSGSAGKCFSGSQPTIQTQPTNQMANAGGTATFSVVASGSPPLSYQWLFNGTNNIASATNSSLLLTNVQFADAGSYSVIVTNPYGWTVSSNALLTVNPPPPCVALPGNLVSWWRAEADGNDAIGTNNISSLGGIGFAPGEAGLGFSFDGGSHRVLVPDAPELNFDAGQDFTIEAWIQPQTESTTYDIMSVVDKRYSSGGTDSPQGYELSLGSGKVHARFLSTGFGPAGPDLRDGKFHHIVWTLSRSATNGGKLYVDGAVVLTFDPTPYSGTLLNNQPLRIGNHADPNFNTYFKGIIDEVSIYRRALSANEIASIYQAAGSGKCLSSLAPVITTQPTNQSALTGGAASFSVGASGKRLTYQWEFNGTNIASATNTTLVLTNIQPEQVGSYAVLVSNPYGSVLSSNALLTILTGPHIEVQPVSQLIMPGCDAAFNVTASGSGPICYQWWKDRFALSGETNSTLTIPDAQSYDLGRYFVVVSNPYGPQQTSSNAMLAIDSLPVTTPVMIHRYAWGGVRIWAPDLVANDTDADGDGLSVIGVSPFSTLGGNVSLRGNWVFYSPPAGNTNADSFSYTVSDGHCGGTATGTVAVQTRIDTAPTGAFFVENAGNGSLHLTFIGMPDQTYRVQWCQDLASSNWQDLGSWTADTYGSFELVDTPPANSPARYYRTVCP